VNNSAVGSISDRKWTAWTDETRFGVVHNAFEFDQLGPTLGRNETLRNELGIAPHEFVIGTAFRFVPVKRPMLWIEVARLVWKAHSAVHFVIMGDGPLIEDVRGYAAQHGFAERLHLPGRISKIDEWYRTMDINLLTSEREGLPNVLIEGQHFGVPAIAANVGGAGETLDAGKTGYLVPADADAAVFADAILKTLRDPEWLAGARSRAPAFVHAKFSAFRTIEQLFEYLGISGAKS
jgi:glycosyltransferase involved in cell wall biosynthesis